MEDRFRRAGPALSDFTDVTGGTLTSPTSGALNFSDPDSPYASIEFHFTPTANEPRYETFTIELFDPSASGALNTASSISFSVFNPAATGTSPPDDILWQNASTGQASIWGANGNSLTIRPVIPYPGPSFRAVGTGDFNKDGKSDILWQNTNTGQASIWEMNGNALIGGGPVTPSPGLLFNAVGTGDFNGDGFSDILWQNTSTGQASIWEMNGNTSRAAAR